MSEFSKKIRKFFNKKKFKYGGYAVAMTIGVVVVVFLLNLLLIYLDDNFNLSLDLTANKVYSLTMQTEHVLDELTEDIYVYTLYSQGSEDETMTELLERYKALSDKIHVQNIDMVRNPGAVSFYENEKNVSVSSGGLIVSTSGDPTDPKQRFKLLDAYDIYSYDSETESFSLFTGEDAVTGAMLYVLNPDIPKVWFLEGHGAKSTNWAEMVSYLERENYDTGSINLITEAENLEKGDILVVLSPNTDLANDERETLLDFALDGGKIIFMFDPVSSVDIPNFMLILSHYNISMEDGMILEDINNGGSYLYDQSYLVPSYNNHEITSPLISNGVAMIAPRAGAIKIGPDLSGIEIKTLLESSDQSFVEPISSEMDNVKNDGAETGPFPIMVAMTKNATQDTEEAQIIIASSSAMFLQMSQMPTIGNYELFLNSVSWLNPAEDDFYIRGKSLKTSVLYFESNAQINAVRIIVVIAVPLLAFVAALVVYLKRRHL